MAETGTLVVLDGKGKQFISLELPEPARIGCAKSRAVSPSLIAECNCWRAMPCAPVCRYPVHEP